MNTWNRNGSLQYPVAGGIDMQSLMRQVYTWMVLGMLTTSVIAFVTVSSPRADQSCTEPNYFVDRSHR